MADRHIAGAWLFRAVALAPGKHKALHYPSVRIAAAKKSVVLKLSGVPGMQSTSRLDAMRALC